MSGEGNDFEIAGKVSALISGLPKDRQHKILRWVAESVDMSLAGGGSVPGVPVVSQQPVPSRPDSGRAVDVKTFVESKSPRSDVQFAAAVAYYYRFEAPADQ